VARLIFILPQNLANQRPRYAVGLRYLRQRHATGTGFGALSEEIDISARMLLLSAYNTSSARFEMSSFSKTRKM
jgi:hypothetical protein